MACIFRGSVRSCSPEDLNKVKQLVEMYGIDPKKDATLLGYGAYKEVHASERYPGVVVIITAFKQYFYDELEALKQMGSAGLPVIEYHTYMEIGPFIIALAKQYGAPNDKWDAKKSDQLREKVAEHLRQLFKKGFITSDLQYLVDEDDQPIFNDPLAIHPAASERSEGSKGVYVTASCKHQGAYRFDVATWVEFDK